MTSTIDEKLQELRKLWKAYPERRSTIELQAKILKTARDHTKPYVPYYHKNDMNEDTRLEDNVKSFVF